MVFIKWKDQENSSDDPRKARSSNVDFLFVLLPFSISKRSSSKTFHGGHVHEAFLCKFECAALWTFFFLCVVSSPCTKYNHWDIHQKWSLQDRHWSHFLSNLSLSNVLHCRMFYLAYIFYFYCCFFFKKFILSWQIYPIKQEMIDCTYH